MANKLKGTLAFSGLPSGYETEIVARKLDLSVNGQPVSSVTLAVTAGPFEFTVENGDNFRIEYRYVDAAGNVSENPQVLDGTAHDVTPPPSPSDGSLVFAEVPGSDPAPPATPQTVQSKAPPQAAGPQTVSAPVIEASTKSDS